MLISGELRGPSAKPVVGGPRRSVVALVGLLTALVVVGGWAGIPRFVELGRGGNHLMDTPVRSTSSPVPTWSQVATNQSPPGLVSGYAMAYDPVDGYLVVFGGCDSGDFWFSTCQSSNDTWIFSNGNWTKLLTSHSPPPRYYSSLVWDGADQYLVLFGGNGTGSTGFLNDTWTFVHGTWTQLQPPGSPERRAAASMVYDPADGYVLLYGGEGNRTLTNHSTNSYSGWDYSDTWTFANATWSWLNISGPPARDSASITFDSNSSNVVLFGGFNWSTYNQADTWQYSAGQWTQVAQSSKAPWARNNGAFAYDPALGGDVLFGGHQGYFFMNDTNLFSNGSWTTLSPSVAPSTRWGSSLALDPSVGCLVLLGGYAAYPNNVGTSGFFNDTWVYGINCSVPVVTSGGGGGAGGGGGIHGGPPANLTGYHWVVDNVSGPTPVAAAGMMAYDPADGYLVLFGGCDSGSYWFSTCHPTNSTWVFNGTWTQLRPAVSPQARFYSQMAWDAADGYMVLFGGNGSGSVGFLNDTWTFVGGVWTPLNPALSPGARAGESLTYDPALQEVILFGGEGNRTLVNAGTNSYSGWDYSDTWSFSHGYWSKLNVSGPAARDAATLAYDPATSNLVLFGGFNWTAYNLWDTWTFNGSGWRSIAPLHPAGRNGGAMATDPGIPGAVLFGGHDGYLFYNDTQVYSNGTWTTFQGSGAPSARWGASLADDPAVGCLIMFGGFMAYPSDTYYNDTWVFGQNCSLPAGSGGSGAGGGSGGGGSGGNHSGNHSGNNSTNSTSQPHTQNPHPTSGGSGQPWWDTAVSLSTSTWALAAAVAAVGVVGLLVALVRSLRRP